MRCILITFSVRSEKFENNTERNKFFRSLYGWKQIVPKKKRVYIYRRRGLLNLIPHIKVDQSSFIVREKDLEEIERFFDEWSDKIIWRKFKVMVDKELKEIFEEW